MYNEVLVPTKLSLKSTIGGVVWSTSGEASILNLEKQTLLIKETFYFVNSVKAWKRLSMTLECS